MTNDAVCIGLDLAWGERNHTGGAVLRGGELVAWTGVLGDNASILDFVADHLGSAGPAVIAVDAPLRVPNEAGRRRCDHLVSMEWARFEAGAYPANRRLLARRGVVRGEELSAALAARCGCRETAPIPQRGGGRYVCEVFPHPAHVALFGLDRTFKYKRKPGRSPALLAAELRRYQAALAALEQADPPLRGHAALTDPVPADLRGRLRQEREESLDALTCAYVGWYAWWHGPARQLVYGSPAEGHILVPLPKGFQERLQRKG